MYNIHTKEFKFNVEVWDRIYEEPTYKSFIAEFEDLYFDNDGDISSDEIIRDFVNELTQEEIAERCEYKEFDKENEILEIIDWEMI